MNQRTTRTTIRVARRLLTTSAIGVLAAIGLVAPLFADDQAAADKKTPADTKAPAQKRVEPRPDRRDTRLPEFTSGRFTLPPIAAASTSTEAIGNGRLPDGFRSGVEAETERIAESADQRGFAGNVAVKRWAAPNTFGFPRYFEDRMLERHGHERGAVLQPLASGARFFATIPLLPYLTTVSPPRACEYTLGYHRPGDCVPRYLQRPPWEQRAAIAEGVAVGAGIAILP